jgi:hypothetical protein
MTNKSNELMNKIEMRVSHLINTKDPAGDLKDMYRLQMEHTPNLTHSEAQDYVIQGLIEIHKDHELDHLWYQFKNTSEESSEEAA